MWILISHPENTFGTCSLPLGLGGFALGCGYSGKGALSSSESTGRVIGESGLFPPAHGDTLGKSSPSASENAARQLDFTHLAISEWEAEGRANPDN